MKNVLLPNSVADASKNNHCEELNPHVCTVKHRVATFKRGNLETRHFHLAWNDRCSVNIWVKY